MKKTPLMMSILALLGGCTCEKETSKKQPEKPAVVIVDPDELTRPKPEAEKEPNNDRRQAQNMPNDQWIAGTIHAANSEKKDVDWYHVQVTTEGQILKATLTGVPDLDLSLEAYDHGGKRLVKVNNSREGGGEVLINLSVSTGDYYLKVRDVKNQMSPESYRINYQLVPKEQGDEIEPNWKPELATPLALEEEAIGYLGWHKDMDWYQVDLKDLMAGSRLKIEFDGVDNVRANLSLRTKKGAVLQQRWAGAGESMVLPNIALPKGISPLFIVVRWPVNCN